MRNRFVLLLIFWLAAFPVWGKLVWCCHLDVALAQASSQPTAHCDHHGHAEAAAKPPANLHAAVTAADAAPDWQEACHCDYVQHSQFLAALPWVIPAVPPQAGVITAIPLRFPPAPPDLPYRPPIA